MLSVVTQKLKNYSLTEIEPASNYFNCIAANQQVGGILYYFLTYLHYYYVSIKIVACLGQTSIFSAVLTIGRGNGRLWSCASSFELQLKLHFDTRSYNLLTFVRVFFYPHV